MLRQRKILLKKALQVENDDSTFTNTNQLEKLLLKTDKRRQHKNEQKKIEKIEW